MQLAGYQVVRYGGATRYGTALQIAELGLDNPANVILASGDIAADALVAGPYAAGQNEVAGGKPAAILLSGSQAFNVPAITDPATAAYLRGHLQGEASTIPACQKSIVAVGFPALAALKQFAASTAPTLKKPCSGVASGTQFPDALSGAAYEASFQQPLLLTGPTTLPSFTAAALTDAVNRSPEFGTVPFTVTVFGGTAAVSQKVEAGIAAAAHAQIQ